MVVFVWKVVMQTDSISRFTFQRQAIRGALVHLDDSFNKIMEAHQYPAVIRSLLGEALISVVLLTHTIKFDGQLTLQLQGDGPVTLLVAKCDSEHHIRGLAQWQKDILPMDVPAALGKGRLVVTIDYDKKVQPYQSIIPIEHQTIPQALEAYFMTSEQLPTRIYTAVSESRVSGLLLQALPEELHKADQSDWVEVSLLADTITAAELLELDNTTLLKRLFNEYDICLFDPTAISFKCRCSVERMKRAIITLGEQEARQLLRTNKEIEVTCEYCNNQYAFNAADINEIFKH